MSPRRIGVGVVLAGVLAGCQAANTPEFLTRAERNLEVSRGQLQRELDQRKDSLGLMGASLTGCSLERRQVYELDAEQESALGQAVAARQLATLGLEPLPATDPVAHYVDQVGQYLALVAAAVSNSSGPERAGRPERALNNRPWPHAGYQFRVLPLEEARATGGPGGIVMISTGFLRLLESEEELAAVLAHEVAHVQRGHGVEAIKAAMCHYEARQESSASLRAFGQRIKLQRETAASGSPLAQERVPGELLRGAAEEAVNLYREGFLEDFELEADRITVRILMGAGYDAHAFSRLIQRSSLETPAKHPWRRMHPPPRARLAVVGERITALGPTQVRPPPDAVEQRKKRFLDAMGALPALMAEPQSSQPPP